MSLAIEQKDGVHVALATVHRATGVEHAATIDITEPWETAIKGDMWLPFRTDAEHIFRALSHALPGGTLDHLFALLAADKASSFVVGGHASSCELMRQAMELIDQEDYTTARNVLRAGLGGDQP